MRLPGPVGMSAAVGLFVVTLAGFLVGWAERDRPATTSRASPPPRHPPLSPQEAERLLRRWLADWAGEAARFRDQEECGWRRPGRFVNEWDSRTTDFRLLVLGYPHVAEMWARSVAGNETSPGWERARALTALGILAEAGCGGAESALVELGWAPGGHFRSLAVHWLAGADRSGAHRDLYRHLARKGDWAAIEALSRWADPEAVEVLKEILHQREGIAWGYAAESLARIQALVSGDWHRMALEAILSEPGLVGSRFYWALNVAMDRRAPWLESILRLRLDAAEPNTLLRRIPPHLEVADGGFDEALLTLAEIGGTPTPPEQLYLRHFGYGGDPRKRLAEILAERASPHQDARP